MSGATSSRGTAAMILSAYLAALGIAVAAAGARSPWRTAIASAYSTRDSPGEQGCPGYGRLRDDTLTFASRIVPCGARVELCVGRRCVVAVRADSGPFVAGRSFDLAFGTVRALGYNSPTAFGVRSITWRRR